MTCPVTQLTSRQLRWAVLSTCQLSQKQCVLRRSPFCSLWSCERVADRARQQTVNVPQNSFQPKGKWEWVDKCPILPVLQWVSHDRNSYGVTQNSTSVTTVATSLFMLPLGFSLFFVSLFQFPLSCFLVPSLSKLPALKSLSQGLLWGESLLTQWPTSDFHM